MKEIQICTTIWMTLKNRMLNDKRSVSKGCMLYDFIYETSLEKRTILMGNRSIADTFCTYGEGRDDSRREDSRLANLFCILIRRVITQI